MQINCDFRRVMCVAVDTPSIPLFSPVQYISFSMASDLLQNQIPIGEMWITSFET
jgi:hypothetical protein